MATSNAPLCFCDTETDGVHPGRRPWEIALIRREPDGGEKEVSVFVEIDLSTANLFGLQVGRFYDRHPLGRWLSRQVSEPPVRDPASLWSPLEAARGIARMTHGAHLVGAVPNFDAEVFDRLLRDNGLCPAWHYHLIDVENLAVGYLAAQLAEPQRTLGTFQPPWKSDELNAALGLEPVPEDQRHTALGDARWAMRIYDAVMGGGAS